MPERNIVDRDVDEWVRRIALRHKTLDGGSSCPFASNYSIKVEERSISDVCPIDGVDVAIFIIGDVALSHVFQACTELNMRYSGYYFFGDCIDNNLIIVQKKIDISESNDMLSETKYCQNWSEELYKKVVKKG